MSRVRSFGSYTRMVPKDYKPRYVKDMNWLEKKYYELKRRFNNSRLGWTVFFFKNWTDIRKNKFYIDDYRIIKRIRNQGGVFENERFNI